MELLGGLSVETFLSEYWQKKPLLVRQAVPGFAGLVSAEDMNELACRDDAISRLVRAEQGVWQLEQGPFDGRRLKKLQKGEWSLLVSNLNHFLPEAAELFYRFNFIPCARLDDLMVSYAPQGGTVGPHFDSYDVFLLQAGGRKRWQVSAQQDHTLIEGAPLKILQHFTPEQEWVLEPGDMLYLPPRYAHNGVALEPGMTYSVGFRAPSAQELATQFLAFLQDQIELDGMYADPDLVTQKQPALLGEAMVDRVEAMLSGIRWGRGDVKAFLGHYLSEPKAHVLFDPPENELSVKQFAKRIASEGVVLDLKTQMLHCDDQIFCNGESVTATDDEAALLAELANARHLPARVVQGPLLDLMYEWFEYGYLHLGTDPLPAG